MAFTVTNQKPAVLDPFHTIPSGGPYDPIPAMRKVITAPMFEQIAAHPVSIVDDHGVAYDEDMVFELFQRTMTGLIDNDAETAMKDLLAQCLIHYDPQSPLLANEMFAVQAAHTHKLPAPGPHVIYAAGSDVIPASKALLASPDQSNEQLLLASLAYTYSPETLGFWFLTESAYEDFRTWFAQEISALAPVLPGDTMTLLQKFQQLTLPGLTESLILRKDDGDQLQDHSFARVLVHLLMQYSNLQKQSVTNQQSTALEAGILPFTVTELFLPRTVVLVNVEQHARSSNRRVDAEWKLIDSALSSPVKVLNLHDLSKLTALPRALQKAAAAAANARTNALAQTGRAAKVAFRKQAPNTVDILKGLLRVLGRMKEVNRSQNVFKKVRTSFARANRRNPDDYNKPGKSVSTHYLPDLHLYCDTSGSISENNYQQAVLTMIKIAKKLNVNLYFNSFSHVMSQQVMLRTAGKSVAQIWAEFQKIPKVDGGTDYEQIWRYINASPERRRRLSLVISDFEFRARSQRFDHPKNLYYAPCGDMDWDRLVHHAKAFTKSVEHMEPAIAQHLIGMTV